MNKIECINLSKSFFLNNEELNVLNEINLSIEESNLIAITGKSGAGKSTFLNNIIVCEVLLYQGLLNCF